MWFVPQRSRDIAGNGTSYYADGGVMRRMGYASGNGIYYLLGDHLGSTAGIVSEAGSLVAQQDYYPYGSNRGAAQSELTAKRFTGQYHEADLAGDQGLYYYNARWYDPALGHFIQADSLVPQPSDPQSLNRYSYVLNNPVKYNDPTGHYTFEEGPDDPLFRAPTTEDLYPAMRSWTMAGTYNVDIFTIGRIENMISSRALEYIRNTNEMARVTPSLKPIAFFMWAEQVDTGRDWDFKGKVEEKYGNHKIRIGPRQLDQDIVANVTYGYAGRAAGFTAAELRIGAGLQQIWQHGVRAWRREGEPNWALVGDLRSFGDDPRDQAAIQVGIDLYDSCGLECSVGDLQRAVYPHVHQMID